MLLGRPQNAQVPPAADLDALTHRLTATGRRRPRGLPDGVGQRFEIIRTGRGTVRRQPHHLPAAGGGQSLGVFGAQVITVWLRVRRQRAENSGRVGVYVREREDGRLTASGAGTAADGAHGGTVSGKSARRHYLSTLNERVATIRTPVAAFPPRCPGRHRPLISRSPSFPSPRSHPTTPSTPRLSAPRQPPHHPTGRSRDMSPSTTDPHHRRTTAPTSSDTATDGCPRAATERRNA